MNEIKMPRLGSNVYIITEVDGDPFCVTKAPVYMKNKEAFIVEDALDDGSIEEFRRPQYLEDYGYTWVKTFKEVKDILVKYEEAELRFGGKRVKYRLEKVDDTDWNVEAYNVEEDK